MVEVQKTSSPVYNFSLKADELLTDREDNEKQLPSSKYTTLSDDGLQQK